MKTKKYFNHNRRNFLKSSAALGAFSILPSHLVFGKNASSGELPPSEKVNLAIIGIGNQGDQNRKQMLKSGLCNIVALCDVDLKGDHAQESLKAHPDVRRFTDFRKMFDAMANDIDAVLIATPDHSHFCASMLAMSLGKPIYVQKPLAHSFAECERLINMAQKSGVVTQMGNQGYSGANYFQFKAWSEAGIIKDVTRITAYMNGGRRWHGWGATVSEYPTDPLPEGMDWDTWVGPAPMHPFSRKLHPQEWRSWYDYGCGAFGDWGPHILDTAHSFLNLGLPTKITPVKLDGANPLVFPQASTIRFDFPQREGGLPACAVTWYDGVDNKPDVAEELATTETNPLTRKTVTKPFKTSGAGSILYAKDAIFLRGSHGSPTRFHSREKYKEMYDSLPKFPTKNSDHMKNFLLACKGEEEARSPFSISGPLTQVFNLGIITQKLGETLNFDRTTKQITNNSLANTLLDPDPRKGWEEFYRM